MKIEVRLYATLRKYAPEGSAGVMAVEAADGVSVQELLQELNIDLSEVILVMVNGISVERNWILADGDRLGVFPPVGGG